MACKTVDESIENQALISLDNANSDQVDKEHIVELLRKHHVKTATIEGQETKLEDIIPDLKKAKVNIPEGFFRDLASKLGLPYLETSEAKKFISKSKKSELTEALPCQMAIKYLIVPLQSCKSKAVIAASNPLNKQCNLMLQYLYGTWQNKIYVVSSRTIDWAIEYIFLKVQKQEATTALCKSVPEQSANKVLFKRQKYTIAIVVLATALALLLNPVYTFAIIFSAVAISYFVINPIKIYTSLLGFKGPRERARITEGELLWVLDEDLPVYTILVPVYKEAKVLPQILKNIYKLNYPKNKLDVKILMEEKDHETLSEARKIGLFGSPTKFIEGIPNGEYGNFLKIFDPVVVPCGKITTKPRACNYGLMRAMGELCVIYDAEDNPEPNQLKKAAIVFLRTGENIVCLQSKLNFYNKNENLLTKWFSIEYSYWYEFYLPGLDWINAPIPLGGTSNHFRIKKLEELGRWDPYNMTEDADLGLRIARKTVKTQMIESTTLEEATISVKSWIRQRSRWYKGHVQTYLVHMRYPRKLLKDLGLKKFIKFQLTFGGSIFVPIINPILWAITALTLIAPWLFNLSLPSYIQTICVFNLFFGNITYIALYVIASVKLKSYRSILHSLTMPLYWVLLSIASCRGLIQLIRKPFYWDKTTHGISTPKTLKTN